MTIFYFTPKSFWIEVNIWRMDLVVEDVHDPGGEECSPPNDDQAGDLGPCLHHPLQRGGGGHVLCIQLWGEDTLNNYHSIITSLLFSLTVTPLALHNSSAKGEETRYFQFQLHSQLLKTNLLKLDVGCKIWKLPNRMDGTIGEKYIFGEKYFFGEQWEVSKSSM